MTDEEKAAEERFAKLTPEIIEAAKAYINKTYPHYDDFDFNDFELKLWDIFRAGMEHGRNGYTKISYSFEDYIKADKAIEVVADLLEDEWPYDSREEVEKDAKKLLGLTDKGEG